MRQQVLNIIIHFLLRTYHPFPPCRFRDAIVSAIPIFVCRSTYLLRDSIKYFPATPCGHERRYLTLLILADVLRLTARSILLSFSERRLLSLAYFFGATVSLFTTPP